MRNFNSPNNGSNLQHIKQKRKGIYIPLNLGPSYSIHDKSESYERISVNFCGGVEQYGARWNCFDFDGDRVPYHNPRFSNPNPDSGIFLMFWEEVFGGTGTSLSMPILGDAKRFTESDAVYSCTVLSPLAASSAKKVGGGKFLFSDSQLQLRL